MSPTSPFLTLERDERIVEGRAKRAAETYYVVPGCTLTSVATSTLSSNFDCFSPWQTSSPIVVDQLAFEVTTLQSGNARVGFYRADRDWQPIGAPLADSGDISTNTTGVKTYTPGTPIAVRPGRYLSVITNNAAATFRQFIGGGGGSNPLDSALGSSPFVRRFFLSRSYAAFPTPSAAWDTESLDLVAMHHMVVYRLSRP